jgi:DNA-binding CsgD family transcriptional regulator
LTSAQRQAKLADALLGSGRESTRTRLIGRERELAVLAACLEDVRAGRAGVVLVEGPAGIGKTALVERFLDEAEGVTVIRGSGEQAEGAIAYGLADQLLRAMDGSGEGVLGEGESFDHVSTGLRLLAALGELERGGPVVMAVDDAHWADAASLTALLFAGRRLVVDRVLLVVVVRDDEPGELPPGMRRLAERAGAVVPLTALTAGELQALAAAEGVALPAGAATRLHAHTSGNPLHALALLRELGPEAWQDARRALPVPRSFAEIVLASLAACSAHARRLVEAAAVLTGRTPLAVTAAAAEVDAPLDALEEAAAARLLAADAADEHVTAFPHPLVETAVYRQIGTARRARLHRAAASLVDDAAVALRHRVAAAATADAELAGELERFAAHEESRTAWPGVAWALAAAARLSEPGEVRERRMLAAAEAALFGGDFDHARRLLEGVTDPANGPRRDCVLAFVELHGPHPREAEPLLARAHARCDAEVDPATAARIASSFALLRLMDMRGAEAATWAQRATALTPAEHGATALDEMLAAVALAYAGRGDDAEAAARAALAANPEATVLMMALGWVLLARDDLTGATEQLGRAAAGARRDGSFEQAAIAHAHLCRAEYMAGRWDAALAHGTRALGFLGELPHLNVRPLVRWSAALVPAARGDWATIDELAAAAEADAAGTLDRRVVAALLCALPAAGRGDRATVLEQLAPFAAGDIDADGLDEPGLWPWHDLYAEALVAADRLDEAAAFLAPHEARAQARGLASAQARLGRARGRLEAARGDAEVACATLRGAIDDAERAGMPFEVARARLALGAVLRRIGRRRDAAAELRAAQAVLTSLRAAPELARCERELAACGLTPAKRGRPQQPQLTPQERSVAELVASGMTNREVAAELLVSVKTVEVHLTRIYAKLGIASRAQLAARPHYN